MAFASKNPFRTSVAPSSHDQPNVFDLFNTYEASPPPMTPSHSAPGFAYRAPVFNSNNPFFDVVDTSVALRRTTSDTDSISPLPDLLSGLSVKESAAASMPPPPPPPRSSRRHNLHEQVSSGSEEKTDRGIVETYMPLDRDNRPRETPPPARHRAHTAHLPSRRRASEKMEKEQEDPFATPPAAESGKAHRHHRHAASSTLPSSRDRTQRSLSRDRSRREKDETHRHKSRSSHAHSGEKSSSPSKHHHAKSSSPPTVNRHSAKKPSASLDKIDKLDVTGIFGTGFHHDGPFDACNPHRNTNKNKAPMLAFPIDSENNSLGMPRHLLEQQQSSASSAVVKQNVDGVIDPALKATPVHGNSSLGLGTSTFLEGAPASRAAIIQQMMRDKDSDAGVIDFSKVGSEGGAGLTRKKSIMQKIIGINKERTLSPINVPAANRARSQSVGEVIVEEEITMPRSADSVRTKFDGSLAVAPRMLRQTSSPSTVSTSMHSRSPTSPREENGARLLNRVRSLKVGRKRDA